MRGLCWSHVIALGIAVVSVKSLPVTRREKPIVVHNKVNDYYDPEQKAAVAELICNYSMTCSASCTKCHAIWSGMHQGKKVNVSESDAHVVWTRVSECAAYLKVMWKIASPEKSYYECKVTSRHSRDEFLSDPIRLLIKIPLAASTANVTAELGSNLDLICPSKEVMPPKDLSDVRCIWLKDGKHLPANSSKFLHSNRPSLKLFNVSYDDAGTLECKLKGNGITKSAAERSIIHVIMKVSELPTVQPEARNNHSIVATSWHFPNNTEASVRTSTVNESGESTTSGVIMTQIPTKISYKNPPDIITTEDNELEIGESEYNGKSDYTVYILSGVAILILVLSLIFIYFRGRTANGPEAVHVREDLKEIKGTTREVLDKLTDNDKEEDASVPQDEFNEHPAIQQPPRRQHTVHTDG
ncbi:uncharacterized protein [Oscarella lobularis]